MTFKARSLVVVALAALFAAAYTAARLASPRIVAYVVEEALFEKAPSAAEAGRLRERLGQITVGIADPSERTRRLLALSAYLEKVQVADPAEVERVLADPRPLP